MAEYSAVGVQEIAPGASAVFTVTVDPCLRGLVQHFDGTSGFLLSGNVGTNNYGCCCCQQNATSRYLVVFGANIAIAEGGTVGEISVAYAIDGIADPASIMRVTPAAAEEYQNVSRAKSVPIFRNCCQTVSIQNTSTQTILMQNATLRILVNN